MLITLVKLCLLLSIMFVAKYSADIPAFTPEYAKDILEFAKKYRYKVNCKHGISLTRTNETLNVSSEYENSNEQEYFVCEANSSYELDDTDLSTAMSWMDGKTTPESVEKMTLNISDYHFNIDKQFAHQLDYDFNDSFPVNNMYSDDGIQEPIVRNYWVRRNESYYLKDFTELFSSYERQFLPTAAENLKDTFYPPKTTTRNFSRQHASNPHKRLYEAWHTFDFVPMLNVGDNEVTMIDYPTTLTEYREPFFVYVHRLSETNVTFYHNKRKYYFRDGTMIRDLNGLKYFKPNFTYPYRKTRNTRKKTTPGGVGKTKRTRLKSSKHAKHKDSKPSRRESEANSIVESEEIRSVKKDTTKTEHINPSNRNDTNDTSKTYKYDEDSVCKFIRSKLEALLTTTPPSTTTPTPWIQPLFTLPTNKHAPIRLMRPDPNLVTFIIKVAHNNSFIYIADKRIIDPNFLHSSIIYASNVRRNKEWERNYEHLNMNLFGRHRNHKLFTSTTPTHRPPTTERTMSIPFENYTIYDSSLYVEIL